MVDQLSSFADEVTRVAREVGTEGILGGQANVKGVRGTWKDLTDSVNGLSLVADDPGAQHRGRHDRGRERRPLEEDHRRRARRGARAEGDDQRDGRPAARVLVGGDARRPRGRLRGDPRRPGPRRRRLGRVGRPDRQRQLHGVEPDDSGAQHRRRHDRGRERRPDAQDHRRGVGRGRGAGGHDQHDGRPALVVRRRGHARRARGRHRGHPRRPGQRQGRLAAPGRT